MPFTSQAIGTAMTAVDIRQRVSQLATLHGPMVFTTAYRILGTHQGAEDVQQEVFVKLLRKRDQAYWDQVKNWPALLRVMAQNAALDVLRRNTKRHFVDIDQEPLSNQEDRPDKDVLQLQRARQLRAALNGLSKDDANLFGLRFFEDFSYKQIAEHLGMSTNRVGVQIHRIKNRIRELISLKDQE